MRRASCVVGALLLALWGLGCEEDVTAVLGTERPYSLYGVLSPQLDTQWVRVFPVEGRLLPAEPVPLDVRFTSTDLESGEARVWRDSILQEPGGQYAHVFWSPFEADYGHTYRIAVEGDGGVTSVEAAVPPWADVVFQEPRLAPSLVMQPVLFEGAVERLLKIEVEYGVDFKPINGGPQPAYLTFSYDGRQQASPQGWVLPIDLSGDFRAIQDTLALRAREPLDRSFGLLLINMTVRAMAANAPWDPPGGVFDANAIVQPGTMSNVENGFGFVGAGYRIREVYIPPKEALEAAGFRPRPGS